MDTETEKYIQQLEKRLVLLEGRVAMLEARVIGLIPVPSVPVKPITPTLQKNCDVCGVTFVDSLGRSIALGYSCGRNNCPTGITYSYDRVGGAVYGISLYENAQTSHLKTSDIQPYNPVNRGDLDL